MIKIFIDYRLRRGVLAAKDVIVLRMAEANADDLLLYQEKSRLVGTPKHKGLLASLLDRLAKLQGYSWAEFIAARAVGYTREAEEDDD